MLRKGIVSFSLSRTSIWNMSYETKNSLYVVNIVTFIRVYNHLFMFNTYLLSSYKMSKSVEDIDSKLWPQKVSVL